MSKVALVTGALGGLGTAISQALAKEGYKVVAAYHPEFDKKEEWLAEQEAAGFKDFVLVPGDVSDYESAKAMIAEAEAKGQWDAVINTNLNSLFNVTHHVAAKMGERGWGRIVNISSVNGVKGQAGQTNYSAAKAGVIGFTKALAQEFAAKGVTVNAIAPGYVATKMVTAIREDILKGIIDSVPMKRLAKPEEIGAAVVYLTSELAGFVTGATLNINGGLYYQ